jgi:hypothetical protein
MSKIALSGNASGTGTFTLASPNSNSDRTINLPDAGGDMVLTTATQTLTNKDIVATQLTGDVAAARITTALNASGSAPIFAARAWVLINGSNGATLASGNVSSTSRLGTGNYEINFATAMPDTNYAVVSDSAWTGAANASMNTWSNQTTTQTRVWARNQTSNIAHDPVTVSVQIFR